MTTPHDEPAGPGAAAPPRRRRPLAEAGARAALALLWLLHWLPLPLQAALAQALGALLHALARSRRRIARRNVALCFPDWTPARRDALVREHFGWLARSLLDRGMLWHASEARLRRLIHVEGDLQAAQRSGAAWMWLVPHFVALDVAGVAVLLNQQRRGASIYQAQSSPVFDAALRAGRLRFGATELFDRHASAKPLLRAVRAGAGFFNLPDMDFGRKDSAFVPFFGEPAATLLAPARMARLLSMRVQPLVAEILPRGRGWRVRALPVWDDFPGADDDLAATRRINAWIEDEIRRLPAQYLWVHRRFKTTPDGGTDRYARDRAG